MREIFQNVYCTSDMGLMHISISMPLIYICAISISSHLQTMWNKCYLLTLKNNISISKKILIEKLIYGQNYTYLLLMLNGLTCLTYLIKYYLLLF